MTSDPPKRKRGPAPTLPDRRKLTVHLPGEMMAALWEAARRQGIGVGVLARRLIDKGLKEE